MYEHHAAREDPIVFTAWKDALSESTYKDMGEQFEDIERKTFGHDGFDDAVRQMAEIEAAFGPSDIAGFDIPDLPAAYAAPAGRRGRRVAALLRLHE